jgi:hypothetical protein
MVHHRAGRRRAPATATSVPGKNPHPRVGDFTLGGDAVGVDAGAAEQLAFHNGDLHACRGEALRQKRPGLSGSDDDCVKLFLS